MRQGNDREERDGVRRSNGACPMKSAVSTRRRPVSPLRGRTDPVCARAVCSRGGRDRLQCGDLSTARRCYWPPIHIFFIRAGIVLRSARARALQRRPACRRDDGLRIARDSGVSAARHGRARGLTLQDAAVPDQSSRRRLLFEFAGQRDEIVSSQGRRGSDSRPSNCEGGVPRCSLRLRRRPARALTSSYGPRSNTLHHCRAEFCAYRRSRCRSGAIPLAGTCLETHRALAYRGRSVGWPSGRTAAAEVWPIMQKNGTTRRFLGRSRRYRPNGTTR